MSNKKYKLVIMESPSKAKTVEKYIGKDGYKVIASKGHITDLPARELGIDIDNGFKETLVVIPGKESVIKELKEAAADAEEIFLASDPDREGEAISFHIQRALGNIKVPVHRVRFFEITKDAVKAALENPQVLNENMYNSQKTRRILDRLVGYKISPILWDKITSGLSAGRVQSVALRIIVDREDEIRAFKPEEWYAIAAYLKKDSAEFTASYYGENKKNKKVISTAADADKILDLIKGKEFKLEEKISKDKEVKPSPPFTTSQLQQDAASKLGFPTKKTMEIAQKLYEGKSLGDLGTHGLITYMRTDSTRTEEKALTNVRKYIADTYGNESLSPQPIMHAEKKTKDAKVQDAHEAIRPTSMEFTPEVVKPHLSDEDFLLYQLIWKKFVASQMSSCIMAQTVYWFECESQFFKTAGSVVKEPGFKRVYQDEAEVKESVKGGDDEESAIALPPLDLNAMLEQSKEATKKQNWTQPPARYTEPSLVKELEKRGIGRPSTYAAIISNITGKQYVQMLTKYFQPTEIGEVLCKMLVKGFPEHFDVKFTARMEKQLDEIEEGEAKYLEVLKEFWDSLSGKINDAFSNIKSLKPKAIPTGLTCTSCKEGELEFTWRKSSAILTCKKCHVASPAELVAEGEFKKLELNKDTQKICPKCQGIMQLKDGQYGKFYACMNYPTCRNTITVKHSSGVKCPLCEPGEFVEKKSKTGSTYWACNNYPNCKNIVWNKPIAKKCVHCLHPLLEDFKGKERCTKCQKFQNLG